MKVLDLFSGTGSATDSWRSHGDEVTTIDLNPTFAPDILADVNSLDSLPETDFCWASPDCSCYSTLSNWMHFEEDKKTPKTEKAARSLETVRHTVRLMESVRKAVIENPRSLFRVIHGPFLADAGYTRHTVTYCSYGDFRMKPTDIYTRGFDFEPLPICRRIMLAEGQSVLYPHDHARARRGTNKGTMSLKRIDAGRIPIGLAEAIHSSACDSKAAPATADKEGQR